MGNRKKKRKIKKKKERTKSVGREKRTFNTKMLVGHTVPTPALNDATRRCLGYVGWDALDELFVWAILSS